MQKSPTLLCRVINLDTSPERWERVQKHFAETSLSPERFPAVRGWDEAERMGIKIDENAFRRRMGKKPVPGEIGCWCSHMKLLETFLETDCDFCLICEDDIVPCPELGEIVREVMRKPCWDLLRLAKTREKGFHPHMPILEKWHLGTSISGFSYAAGYMVSRRGAECLLRHLQTLYLPLDLAIFHGWWDVREASIFPPPILLDSTSEQSTIQTAFKEKKQRSIFRTLHRIALRLNRYAIQYSRVLQNKFMTKE